MIGTFNNILPFNSLNTSMAQDPTRTMTLRAQYVTDFNRRFTRIKNAVRGAVVTNDVFGLTASAPPNFLAELPPPRHYAFRTDPQKVDAFLRWFNQLVDDELIEVITIHDPLFSDPVHPWTADYILTAYKRGMLKVDGSYSAVGVMGSEELFAAGLISPVNRQTVESLFKRSFEDLKGISAAMSQTMSRILSEGLMNGDGPDTIAKAMTDDLDKINRTRARLIARTEIIRVLNRGFLTETERLSAFFGEEESLVIWVTAQDSRVRDRHRRRHNKIMTTTQAARRIGEPNCRCGLVNYIPQVDGPVPENRRFRGD